jgi:hypothetical protein
MAKAYDIVKLRNVGGNNAVTIPAAIARKAGITNKSIFRCKFDEMTGTISFQPLTTEQLLDIIKEKS